VEGLSETLAKEITPFGLGVTVVEPGAFRTGFRGASMKQSHVRLSAYADTVGRARDGVITAHGKQPGDPVLGSKAIITVLESDRPPCTWSSAVMLSTWSERSSWTSSMTSTHGWS
jgi:NAD(P)-dependent dehydrogenase (short-subunit alcohol dehydrogenase family)